MSGDANSECVCPQGVSSPSLLKMKLYFEEEWFGMDTVCETCGSKTDSHVNIPKLIDNMLDYDATIPEGYAQIWLFSTFDDDGKPVNLNCEDIYSCRINKNVEPIFENHQNKKFRLVGKCINGCRLECSLRNWFGNEVDYDENYPIQSIGDTYFELFLRGLASLDYHNRVITVASQ